MGRAQLNTKKKQTNHQPKVDFFIDGFIGLFGLRRRYGLFYVLLFLADPVAHLTGDPVEHLCRCRSPVRCFRRIRGHKFYVVVVNR